MRITRFGLLLGLLISSAGQANGQVAGQGERNRFEVEFRRWRPTLGSDLEVGGEGLSGTPVFPKEDLGLTDKRETEVRGYLRFGRWLKVRGSRVAFDYQATSSLAREIVFAGVAFPEGAGVDTTLELEHIRGGVEVDILAVREGFLAVVADFNRVQARPNITSPDAEAKGRVLEVRLVTLGLRGRIYLTPALSLTAEASGMKRETSGVITDFEGVITYSLGRNIGVSFGYRNFYTKWLDESDRATFRLRGNFFSMWIRI